MPDWLSIHEPVLVNTIGHCAGAVLFGMLLYFFLLNWRHDREERTRLPTLAAALAFLWNIGSLVALGVGRQGGPAADVIAAGIALPERQVGQIRPVRVDFTAIRQPGGHIFLALAAV